MSNKSITALSIKIAEGQTLETKVGYKSKRPNFTMIGNGTMNKSNIQSIDIWMLSLDMTKAEQLVLKSIRNNILHGNKTGEVNLSMKDEFTESQTRSFRKGFKLLESKDLVRRTKQSHYMINPNALIPLNYEEAMELWDISK